MSGFSLAITFRMGREDWVAAVREHLFWRSPVRHWVLACLVLPGALAVASAARRSDADSFLRAAITGLFICLLALPVALVWRRWSLGTRRPRRSADRMNPAWHHSELSYRFYEEGFDFRSTVQESKCDWASCTAWREDRLFFHLFQSQSLELFIPIPKRAFASDADRGGFRDLLGRKLKQLD